MRIAILGGAGYIGSTLALQGLMQGYDVDIIDNFVYRQGPAIFFLTCFKNCKIYKKDVRDISGISNILSKADVIVPLAAIVGAPACDMYPDAAVDINYKSILQLLNNVSKAQRILFPNTNSSYGTVPNGLCTEETPFNPISLYAKSKCNAEKAIMQHPAATVFRLATVFGISPRMRLDLLVNDLTYKAVYDGKITIFDGHLRRNFVHVHDVARCFLEAIDNQATIGEIFNYGYDDANMTKMELANILHESFGTVIEQGDGSDPDQRDYMVSSKKLSDAGIVAKISVKEGIKHLSAAYTSLFPSNHVYRQALAATMTTKLSGLQHEFSS